LASPWGGSRLLFLFLFLTLLFIYLFRAAVLEGVIYYFWGRKLIRYFDDLKKKFPRNMVKGTCFFLKISKNICHISLKKVLKITKIFGGFGQIFLTFFFGAF
jgi:hypothetical protein